MDKMHGEKVPKEARAAFLKEAGLYPGESQVDLVFQSLAALTRPPAPDLHALAKIHAQLIELDIPLSNSSKNYLVVAFGAGGDRERSQTILADLHGHDYEDASCKYLHALVANQHFAAATDYLDSLRSHQDGSDVAAVGALDDTSLDVCAFLEHVAAEHETENGGPGLSKFFSGNAPWTQHDQLKCKPSFHRALCRVARAGGETRHVLDDENTAAVRDLIAQAEGYFVQLHASNHTGLTKAANLKEYEQWRANGINNALLFIDLVEYLESQLDRIEDVMATCSDEETILECKEFVRVLAEAVDVIHRTAGTYYDGLFLCRNAHDIAVESELGSPICTLHPPYEMMVQTASAFIKTFGKLKEDQKASELLLDVVGITPKILELEAEATGFPFEKEQGRSVKKSLFHLVDSLQGWAGAEMALDISAMTEDMGSSLQPQFAAWLIRLGMYVQQLSLLVMSISLISFRLPRAKNTLRS
jgi:hypothetical protein